MAHLTLGPLYYHWTPEKRRDFYARIADEAPVDVVYLGEAVCSKREPFFETYEQDVIERLERAGKQVVLSSLALLTTPREMETLKEKAGGSHLIEANDVSAIQVLGGKPFIVGPTINVMNEGTLAAMAALGAQRVVMASELSGKSIGVLAKYTKQLVIPAKRSAQGAKREPESGLVITDENKPDSGSSRRAKGSPLVRNDSPLQTEVQVFGRQPLAISMRCYHARAQGRDKDHCRYACGEDPDGLSADTIVGQPILTINGTQTLTRGYVVLLDEMKAMATVGVTHFRLAAQDTDMVAVSELYRAFLDGRFESSEAFNKLKSLSNSIYFINGYYYGKEGKSFVARP